MPNNPNAQANLKPFVKGYDPRRAIAKVPKTVTEARKQIRRIAAELIHIKEKQENGENVEYDITRLDAAIRLKFSSRAPKDFETILKALYPGLLKDDVTIGGTGEGGALVIKIIDATDKSDESS